MRRQSIISSNAGDEQTPGVDCSKWLSWYIEGVGRYAGLQEKRKHPAAEREQQGAR